MVVELTKAPKNVTIIEGFPGFGLVGTITTEFLMDHLQTEEIGSIWFDKLNAIVAIHEGKIVRPISLHYNKKYNLVIVHGVTATQKLEWQIAAEILEVAKRCTAKQIITVEGIGSPNANPNPQIFYYSSHSPLGKKLESVGMKNLREGIIVGVTGAILLKSNKLPVASIFAETASQLPDSRSAAKVIKMLDSLIGLKIDPKPLLKQAEMFENKLKGIMENTQVAKENEEEKAKTLSYMG